MRIGLGCPTGGRIETETVNWIMGIVTGTKLAKMLLLSDTYCDRAHNELAHDAVQAGLDAIMFIDSDQDGPIDIVDRLIRHHKDIVGCAYRCRGGSHQLMPRAGKGLQKEEWIPSGAMLVRTRVFEQTPFPWFPNIYGKSVADFQGSDISFCKKAQGFGGFEVWCDHDLSREIGHYAKVRLIYGEEIYGS